MTEHVRVGGDNRGEMCVSFIFFVLMQQLVNVHLGEFVLCRLLFRACRRSFVWVRGLVLWYLLAVDRPVLRLLFLRRLYLRLGFGNHRVAGRIKLLRVEEISS